MLINFAHLRAQNIDFAVFDADAVGGTDAARNKLLAQLTDAARARGLRIQKSALAFAENGQLKFFGTPDLVEYLVNNPFIEWTHTLTI